jgi:group II intron reverse transcriptase/maturase
LRISEETQGEQKTSKEGCLRRVGLEAREEVGVQSAPLASTHGKTESRERTADLMERILDSNNLNGAMKRVIRNKGSHGIDGMQVDELMPYLKEHGLSIVSALRGGTYRPQPVKKVVIPKPDGGTRELGIPTVIDRWIQQAVAQVLTQVFDPGFSESSFGFRPGRSAHMALNTALQHINDGHRYVVDIDLEKFFDRVNHDILMGIMAKKVEDKRVLKLIRCYLEAGIMTNGVKVKSQEGTPQGGPLSPLLSNILLDELDKELERRGHRFCRYADDCNVYVKSRRAGERVMISIRQFVEERLKLKVNEQKSAVDSPVKRKFLGYSFYNTRGQYKLRVHAKSFKRLKNKIRDITNRNASMNFEARVRRLTEVTRGWVNYFKLADMKNHLKQLDEWVRRRLRACIWKTWKHIRTRYANLKKLGIPEGKAWEFANTRKGYWRISNSPIVSRAITNARLEKRGYISMSNLFSRA